MISTKGYAVHKPDDELALWHFERRDVDPHDVQIDIMFCGICHSDIHQARGEWNNSNYPMVPGHEIVGRVVQVGDKVTQFKPGDLAGVGCMVDSCGTCPSCQTHQEQFCYDANTVYTYNSFELDKKTLTFGGYSSCVVVKESFVLKISDQLPLAATAPLLCAGITTYSPLKKYGVGKGHRLGVVGLGGLGHMAVKLGASMGAEVIVLSTSSGKKQDALRLGAHHFVNTNNKDEVKPINQSLDFIIDTVSAPHDYDFYLKMLKTNGHHINVGIPSEPITVQSFSLMGGNKSLAASSIGGIKETQEMLDYCAAHQITADIEMIDIKDVNKAYERILRSDVKYRFVIDMNTL